MTANWPIFSTSRMKYPDRSSPPSSLKWRARNSSVRGRKKPLNLDAWDYCQRGMARLAEFTKSGNDILVQVKGHDSQTVYWVGTIEYQSVKTDA